MAEQNLSNQDTGSKATDAEIYRLSSEMYGSVIEKLSQYAGAQEDLAHSLDLLCDELRDIKKSSVSRKDNAEHQYNTFNMEHYIEMLLPLACLAESCQNDNSTLPDGFTSLLYLLYEQMKECNKGDKEFAKKAIAKSPEYKGGSHG
jgi:hypothetical protein